jgi:hypothetical protein
VCVYSLDEKRKKKCIYMKCMCVSMSAGCGAGWLSIDRVRDREWWSSIGVNKNK